MGGAGGGAREGTAGKKAQEGKLGQLALEGRVQGKATCIHVPKYFALMSGGNFEGDFDCA